MSKVFKKDWWHHYRVIDKIRGRAMYGLGNFCTHTIMVPEDSKDWNGPTTSNINLYPRLRCAKELMDSLPFEGPTKAAPGSAEKIEVLRARVAAGLPLWNEGDANDVC